MKPTEHKFRPRHHSAGVSIESGSVFFRFVLYSAFSQSVIKRINIRHLTAERSVIGDADFAVFACMDGGAEQTGAALPHIVAVCVGVIYLTGEQTWFTSPRIVPVGVKMNHTAVYCAGHGRAGIIAIFIEMDFVTKWAVNGRVYLVMAAAG